MSDARPVTRADAPVERALWAIIYALVVLAPVAFLAAAPPSEDSDDVFLAIALGFVAISVVSLQFVISSRAPAFTRPFGIERLIRLHRAAGLLGLGLVAGHVVAVLGSEDDYASWINPVEAPLAGRLGLAAVAALVVLTITALWRRALGLSYEVWRGLHICFGVALVGLAFGHVLAVARFSSTGTIRWLTLGFVVVALLAAFYLRVGRQFAAARRPYAVESTRVEPDGSISLELAADGHSGAPFVPGQFAWLKRAGSPYALAENPFSYATSALDPARPGFTVKPVGGHTQRLKELHTGDRVLIDGPHGSPALVDERDGVLIAGGSGITPAMSVLRTAAQEGSSRRLRLLFFVGDAQRVPLADELAALGTSPNIECTIVPSRAPADWAGPSGRVSAQLLRTLLTDDYADWSYFVCGPEGMTAAAERALRDLGVHRAAIRVERYRLA